MPETTLKFSWTWIACPSCGSEHDTEELAPGDACQNCHKLLPADAPCADRLTAPEEMYASANIKDGTGCDV